MLVTIWQDKDFQYCALFRSFLPKLAVETVGVEPGSAEMKLILEKRAAAVAAWRGWPKKSAVVILVSVVAFCASIVISATELANDDDGNDSTIMLVLRATAAVLGCAGSCVFFSGNVSWRRMHYTFTSTQGILWMFYTLIYTFAGLSRSREMISISNALGTVYTMLGFVVWLSFESVHEISRVMHVTITFTITVTLATVIYLSAYVWQGDDEVLADLNGVGKPGVLTWFSLLRTCFINLLLLMVGALSVSVTKSLPDGSCFVLLTGKKLRQELLEIDSLSDCPRSVY
jgi:hypothetical protein